MTMPTEKEQAEIAKWEAEQKHGPTTTEKINKALSEAEQRILQQMATLQDKVIEHDETFAELGKSFSAGFGRITATAGRLTGKKS